jgi:two-component system, NarL family, nitrate/nitrite response regulator NarL
MWRFPLAAMYVLPPAAILSRVALRCLIVDDNGGFRDAARSLLEREEIQVVGVASNSAEARSRVAELHPDVVLVDIALGGESGFDLARALAREGGPKVILISTLAEVDFVDLIAASPAVGFIAKSELSARAVRDLVADDDAHGARR